MTGVQTFAPPICKVLYGIYFAKQAIAKEDNCYLVEGYTDVIQMYQRGIHNEVSSSGTALTSDKIRLINRLTKNITVLFDGDDAGIAALEKELLAQNAKHTDWETTEGRMATTKNGKALYMHCLPADITGVSCKQGEVAASVFDRYRVPMYKEASYKPYIIAAMIYGL